MLIQKAYTFLLMLRCARVNFKQTFLWQNYFALLYKSLERTVQTSSGVCRVRHLNQDRLRLENPAIP